MLGFATQPRVQFAAELPGNVAAAREAMKAGNGFDGQPLTPRKRAVLIADTLLANHFLREWPSIVVTPPTILVRDTLTIHRTGRTIDIIHHGRAQTDGALSVFVREDSVLAVGDLVGWPIPYSSPKAFVREWAVSLKQMQKLGARVMIPGHGEPIRDTVSVARLIATLEELQRQADDAVRDGLDLAAFRQKLNLRDHRLAFTGGDAALDELWRSYFLFMSAARAHEQAATRRKE
jgi:glyoxylase-like metal-dependent hydrolase (beta-lactamase superfamily II)